MRALSALLVFSVCVAGTTAASLRAAAADTATDAPPSSEPAAFVRGSPEHEFARYAALGNSTGPSIDGHDLPSWFSTVASAALIGVGLVEVVAGYRLFRPTLFMLGSLLAGVPVFLLTWDHIVDPNAMWIGVGLGIAAGLLGGTICYFLYKVGVFAVGGALGVVIALVLNMTVLYKLSPGNANLPFIVGAVILGLGFGGLALYFMRITVIMSTSIVGGYAAIRGIGYFGGNYPSNEFDIEQQFVNGQTNLPWQIYAYFAGWVAIWSVGIGVQLLVTAKKANADEKDQFEKDFEAAELSVDALVGKKRKKSKKGKKKRRDKERSKRAGGKGDALLTQYEQGGEYYDDGTGAINGDYSEYDEGYGDEGYYDGYEGYEEPAPAKGAGAAGQGGKKGMFGFMGGGNSGSGGAAQGKKGAGKAAPSSVQW